MIYQNIENYLDDSFQDPNCIFKNWFSEWGFCSINRQVLTSVPLNIAAVAPYFYPRIGGGETQLHMISSYLISRGHKVVVFTLWLPGTKQNEELDGVQIFRYGKSDNFKGREDGYNEIKQQLRNSIKKFDIIYLHLGIGNEYPTHEMCEILELVQNNRLPNVVRIGSCGRVTEFFNRYKDHTSQLLNADLILALNPSIRRELLDNGVSHSRILMLPNGVNTSVFYPRNNALGKETVLSSYDIPSSSILAVCHSRFAPKKNLITLIRLWNDFYFTINAKKGKRPHLCLIGSHQHEADHIKMKRLLDDAIMSVPKGAISLLPSMDHTSLAKLLRCFDLYLSLSVQEGMSNALLEAMSSGLLCIVPAIPANKALILPNYNGILFKPSSSKDFLRVLFKVAQRGEQYWRTVGIHANFLCNMWLHHEKVISEIEGHLLYLREKKY